MENQKMFHEDCPLRTGVKVDMKKHVTLISIALVVILGLSACNATSESEIANPSTNEIADLGVENIELVDEPEINRDNADIDLIDFTFTEAINSTMEPFSFRILGKIIDANMPRVWVEQVHVHDADGRLLQEIVMDASPRNALEQNRYGLEFGDYNSDGYLDMTIRRYPGWGSNNRTNYYWLWDNEAQQFVYDWRLSEMVTEENLIDFTMTQRIHDEVPSFTIRLLGRWIEGWSSETQDEVEGLDANIHVLQVIDSDGRVIQEFDRLNTIPPRYEPSFGLDFADYNFDGYLDMALYQFEGGSMRNEPHIYWLWDNELKRFVENEELGEVSNYSSISINSEKKRLECYTRFGTGAGATQYFEYLDGAYIFTYSIEWGYELVPDKDGEYMNYKIINELINGEIVTSKEYYDE